MNILINQESLNKFLSDAIDVNKYNLNSIFKLSSFVIEDKIGDTIILYNVITSSIVKQIEECAIFSFGLSLK